MDQQQQQKENAMNLQITEKDLLSYNAKQRKLTMQKLNRQARIKIDIINRGLMSTCHEDPHSEHHYRFKETITTSSGSEAHIFDYLPTNTEMVFII